MASVASCSKGPLTAALFSLNGRAGKRAVRTSRCELPGGKSLKNELLTIFSERAGAMNKAQHTVRNMLDMEDATSPLRCSLCPCVQIGIDLAPGHNVALTTHKLWRK